VQFNSKGAVDGGYIDVSRLRIGLRKEFNAAAAELAAAEEALAQFAPQKTAVEQAFKQAETSLHRRDAERKKAQREVKETEASLKTLKAKVGVRAVK
jgi:chromosome segregation ATPase